jgi:hypothetical protein
LLAQVLSGASDFLVAAISFQTNQGGSTVAADMNTQTVEGVLAYCDWLFRKGYASETQVRPWKIALQKVFETVFGEDKYLTQDTTSLDLDDLMPRFQKLAGDRYRVDSVEAYGRRVRNALEAHAHYLQNGKPPTFRQPSKRKSGAETPAKVPAKKSGPSPSSPPAGPPGGPEFFELEYPLTTGRMVRLHVPKKMAKTDVDRLSAVLRTLQAEEQAQIPERTGNSEAA